MEVETGENNRSQQPSDYPAPSYMYPALPYQALRSTSKHNVSVRFYG
jgi:hypothetical protein